MSLTKRIITCVAAGLILLALLDFFGYVNAGIKSWFFELAYQERMAKIAELEKQNEQLRKDMIAFEQKALELKAKDAILEERQKLVDAKTKEELAKVEQALAEQKKEEELTDIPTDSLTRCERLKTKLIALKIKSAGEINCNEY